MPLKAQLMVTLSGGLNVRRGSLRGTRWLCDALIDARFFRYDLKDTLEIPFGSNSDPNRPYIE